jgi:glycosyltransferase involved in cell wall biosynthesis
MASTKQLRRISEYEPELQKRQTKIVAVIPAYNEERFIGSIVLKVRRYVDQVVVVDDGSHDATAELAAAAGALVIQHTQNQGKGVALNTGFRKAAEFEPTVVITIDADGQHLPKEITQVAQPILDGQADVVIGSRYLEETSRVPEHRIWGHRLFNLITTITSGVSSTDSQSGFRPFRHRPCNVLPFNRMAFRWSLRCSFWWASIS